MSSSSDRCTHPECDESLDMHRHSDRACPGINAYTWHPSNRFTPPPAENSLAVCAIPECKELFGLHHPEFRFCPVMENGKRKGWFDTKFTPAVQPERYASQHEAHGIVTAPHPTGKEAFQAGGAMGKTLHAVEKCADREVSPCPPNTLPFDLAKAMAGEECVTREGNEVEVKFVDERLGPLCVIAVVHRKAAHSYTLSLDKNGRGPLDERGQPWSEDDDLFLAAKEDREECACCGHLKTRHESKSMACIAYFRNGAAVFSRADVYRPQTAPPPPEIEASRSDQSEIDRQIDAGLDQGKCDSCGLHFNYHVSWPSMPNPERPACALRGCTFDPAERFTPHLDPAPPRRVWIAVYPTGAMGYPNKNRRQCDESDEQGTAESVEFIELDRLLVIAPEVRAKLGMG